MGRLSRLIVAVAFGLLGLVAGSGRAAETWPPAEAIEALTMQLEDEAFALWLARVRRIARVSEAIRLHGAPLCGRDTSPVLGLAAARDKELLSTLRPPAARQFGASEELRVLWVGETHAAARGGVRVGDEILQVGGRPIPNAAALGAIHWLDEDETFAMQVRRSGAVLDLLVDYDVGCRHTGILAFDDGINAFVLKDAFLITTGMMRFLKSDDELALIVGHELAHSRITTGGTDRRPEAWRRREREADYLGAYFSARAGFDVSVAREYWRRQANANPWTARRASRSHPGSAARALALDAVAEEIARKRARGEVLMPERSW